MLWQAATHAANTPEEFIRASAAPAAVTLDERNPRINLVSHLQIYEDPSAHQTLAEVRSKTTPDEWHIPRSRHVNQGKNHSVWWLRFTLRNPDQQRQDAVIEVNYNLLDQLDLYRIAGDDISHQQSGDHIEATQRPIEVRNHWLPVTLAPGDNLFYLRVETTSTVFVPLYASTWPANAVAQENSSLAAGLFYGIMLGLFAYNLFLLVSLREVTYFWYLIYAFNMMLFMLVFDGVLWKWLAPGNTIQSLSVYTLMFLHCAVATQFSRHFLHTAVHFPKLDRLLRSKIIVVLASLVVLPMISYDLYNRAASLFVLGSSAILLFSGLRVWRQGFRYGSYYTGAWVLLLCSLMLSTAGSLGYEFFGSSYGTTWVKLGICVEMFILSLGLADRINALQEARYRADEDARQARLESRAQGRFLARMSHEIRTPLNGVLGMLQLLRDTRLDPTQRYYLDTISKSGNTLLTVINDILDFARLESGRVELEAIAFDPEELLSDTGSLFTAQALDKGLNLYCSIAPDIPRQLIGDPTRLKQVLLNLLGNAFKFTEHGYIALDVSGLPIKGTQPRWQLSFSVTDTGIGIAPEARQNLFRSFTQADSSTTRRYGGSGLGLTISQELISMMGGQISVSSAPDEGASFRFTLELPLAPQESPADTVRAENAGRALLIAQQPRAQLTYRLQLQRLGYLVTCQSGATDDPRQSATEPDLLVIAAQGLSDESLEHLLRSAEQNGTATLLIRDQRDHRIAANHGLPGLLIHDTPLLPSQIRELLQQLRKLGNRSNEATPDTAVAAEQASGHLLIAEDNSVNQLVVKTLLEKAGYSLDMTANGVEALAAYRAAPERYDLILMDCEMPVMDGFEATRRIRAHEQREHLPRTPIVALTAHILDSHRLEGMTAGMDDYLAKPVQSATLYSSLKRLIRPKPAP
ncbi:hybrid sensor histidine kinase/response regulator [Halopseudomonas sp.]|uniref:hybrid sensor histidine kinase/response regulator n=1 Tax=Halopseudomonas sp. TaxID=2901191 RepID=UPI0030032E80